VPIPTGDPGPSQPGDLAIASVLARWAELTDDQRAAVREALELDPAWEPAPAPSTTTTDAPPAAAPADQPAPGDDASQDAEQKKDAEAEAEQQKSDRDAAEQEKAEQDDTTGNGGSRSATFARDAIAAYQASLRPLQEVFEHHLGPLGAQVDIVTSRAVVRGDNGQQALAAALLVQPDRCRITVYPATFPAPSGPHHTLAHELFHCYQQHWRGSPLGTGLAWIQEGTAEWAAAVAQAEAGGSVDTVLRNWLGEYYLTPSRRLFGRTYDAVGWFGFLAERTGPLWDRLPAISTAASSDAGYASALGGTAGSTLASGWATTQVGRGAYGPIWSVRSPGLPELDNSRAPRYPSLGNSASQSFAATGYATAQGSASLEANLTRFDAAPSTEGVLRIRTQDRPLAELTGTTWCTDPNGNCTCPPGTARAGESFPRLEGPEAFVAVGAADQAASLTIRGTSLEDECGQDGGCPIGTWQMNGLPAGLPYIVESGGTGTILTVDDAGLLTQDFSRFAPMWARHLSDPDLRSYMAPAGYITGRVRVPTGGERIVDEPIRDTDPSGFGGTGRVEHRGELALEITPGDMQAVALAGQGYGETLLSCVDDDTLTLSGGGILYTYERIS
jgi:hypothetical protein